MPARAGPCLAGPRPTVGSWGMRTVSAVAVLLAGCIHGDYYSVGACGPPPAIPMGDEGQLAIYPSRLQTRWPSGRVPAVALGTSKVWIERYESCGDGSVRVLGLDRLIDSAFSPALAEVQSSWARWELIEATVLATQEGEGTLTVTVEVDRDNEGV